MPSGVTLSSAGVLSGTPAALTGAPIQSPSPRTMGVTPNAIQSFTSPSTRARHHQRQQRRFIVNQAASFTVTATGFPARRSAKLVLSGGRHR